MQVSLCSVLTSEETRGYIPRIRTTAALVDDIRDDPSANRDLDTDVDEAEHGEDMHVLLPEDLLEVVVRARALLLRLLADACEALYGRLSTASGKPWRQRTDRHAIGSGIRQSGGRRWRPRGPRRSDSGRTIGSFEKTASKREAQRRRRALVASQHKAGYKAV